MPIKNEVQHIVLPTPYIQNTTSQRPLSWNRHNTAVVYETAAGVCLRPLRGNGIEAFSETESTKMELFLRPLQEDDKINHQQTNPKPLLTVAAISPDDQYIVAGDTHGTLYCWKRLRQNVSLKTWALTDYLWKTNALGEALTDLKFSHDSQYLGAVGLCGGVLLSLLSESIVGPLMGYGQALSCLTFRVKQPSILVTCSNDPEGHLWFHEYEKSLNDVYQSSSRTRINCVLFSHDGEHLASCNDKGDIEGWTIFSGEKDRTISVSPHSLLCFSWAHDNEHLVVSCSDAFIRIVDFVDGTMTSCIAAGIGNPCLAVGIVWGTSGWVVALCSDGSFHGFKVHHSQCFLKSRQFRWVGLQAEAKCLDTLLYSSIGLSVAADAYGTFVFLDYRKGTELSVMASRQFPCPVAIQAIRLFNLFFIVATEDGRLFVARVPKASELSTAGSNALMKSLVPNYKTTVKFEKSNFLKPSSQDAMYMACIRSRSERYIEASIKGAMAISPTEKLTFSSMRDLQTRVVDTLILDEEHVCAVFTQQGAIVVFSILDPVKEFKLLYTLECPGTILAAATTPDGALVAVALIPHENYPGERLKTAKAGSTNFPCIIEIYEIGDATKSDGFNFVCIYNHVEQEVTCMSFNGLGSFLATADTAHRIQIINLELGKVLIDEEWNKHKDRITALSWHPKNHILCSSSFDCSLRFWDVKAPNESTVFPIPQSGGVQNVVFINETTILATGRDGSIYSILFQQE